jgi:hypothetical protein
MDDVREPVFVFADDGLHVFGDMGAVVSYVEVPDVEEGVYEALFTISGEVITAETSGSSVVLRRTGRTDLEDLRRRLREISDGFGSDPEDLDAVARELLKAEWEARWPKRPRWLDRRLHGTDPPTGTRGSAPTTCRRMC